MRPDRNAEEIAARERVDIRQHSVIYNVTDEMKKAMTGLLDPTFKEVRIGVAEVRDIFKVPKFGTIAGCMVTEGRITRAGDTQARLLRDNVVVYEGKIGSLRRFKDDVSEVKSGFECGIGFDKFNDIKVGDVIEVFAMERVAHAPRRAEAAVELGIRPSTSASDSNCMSQGSRPDRVADQIRERARAAAGARGARSRHRVRDAHARAGHARTCSTRASTTPSLGDEKARAQHARRRSTARRRSCAARSARGCG